MTKKKVVVVGGGTGTHTVLRGLRLYSDSIDIKAVVSMSDSGGSTGRLRDEFGFLPIGDVRNALTALAAEGDEYDSLLRQLFSYRFDKGNGLSGHNFGNLFLTALTDILGSEVAAIKAASHILHVSGEVIPVTTTHVQLVANYTDGTSIEGEDEIEKVTSKKGGVEPGEVNRISALSLTPKANINTEAAKALVDADLIVFGPGDLYTSILANCVVGGFSEAIKESGAKIVYVCNLMSKNGQTVGLHAAEHVSELAQYLKVNPDVVLVNISPLPQDLVSKYEEEGDHPILNNCSQENYQVLEVPFIASEKIQISKSDSVKRSLIRHDSDVLAVELMKILKSI
jgi:uncharacterized cofD-like protein